MQSGIRNCDSLKLNEELALKYKNWCDKNKINDSVWGMWPRFYPEMPISDFEIAAAENNSDCAVVVIGRASGEDRENTAEKGSYYLTDDERQLLNSVTSYLKKTAVLLNIGSIMDFSWIKEYGDKINAVLIVWQGGMESGNAAADLLCGNVNPCGRLSDTAALKYSDYPSADFFGKADYNNYTEDIYVGYRYFETFARQRVLYPFGFGLSYTDFNIGCKKPLLNEKGIEFSVYVQNTGKKAGKEVVQIYIEKPLGILGNPKRELAAFAKTALLNPSENQVIKLLLICAALLLMTAREKRALKAHL